MRPNDAESATLDAKIPFSYIRVTNFDLVGQVQPNIDHSNDVDVSIPNVCPQITLLIYRLILTPIVLISSI